MDYCINFTENPEWHKLVLAYTKGQGVDLVVETIGKVTFNQSMISTKQNGTISVTGFLTGIDANVIIAMITQKCLKLQGFRVGSTCIHAPYFFNILGKEHGYDVFDFKWGDCLKTKAAE